MASPLRIVDAHHHLWDLTALKYGWLSDGPNALDSLLPDPSRLKQNYTIYDFKEDIKNQNVVKSVHIEAACADGKGEVKWVQSIADQYGFPNAIVAHADLTSPNLRELLDYLRTFPNVRGIRHTAWWHDSNPKLQISQEDYFKNETWIKGLEVLAEYGYSFDLQVWQHQLREAATVVARVPKVLFILNHTGYPAGTDEASFKEWKEGMAVLAKNPNVVAKISGLGIQFHNWTVEVIRPYVLGVIEVFGVDRSIFASNFPVDKLMSDYDTLFNAFKEIVKEFPREDLDKLFHDNACRYYRI